MSCEQFGELVHGLVRVELLDTELRESAFAHARNCEACGAKLEAAQELADATESVAQASRGLQTPLRVEAALLKELRELHQQSRDHKRAANYLAVAAAACLLIAGAIGYA